MKKKSTSLKASQTASENTTDVSVANQELPVKKDQHSANTKTAALQLAATVQSSILNTLPANIALLNNEGNIVMVNEAWKQFAASNKMKSKTYGVGDNYSAVCELATGAEKQDGERMAAGLKQILNGDLPKFALEYPCHSPDEKRWFRVEVRPLIENKKTGAVVMHIDITERRQTEDELKISASKYRSLIEQASDAIIVVQPDDTLIEANRSAEKLLGYSRQELLTMKLNDLMFQADIKTNPTKANGLAIGEVKVYERRMKRKDNSEVAVEVSTGKKDNGNVVGMIRDITERKKAEEEALLKDQHYRALIENIHDGIVLINDKSETIYQNPTAEQLTGFTMQDTSGKSVYEFIHEDDREGCIALFMKALAEPEKPFEGQYRIKHKEGYYIWIEGSITNFLALPSVKAFVVNYREVTERVAAEQALLKTYREISDYKFALDESSIVSFTDARGYITYANDNFCKISGYALGELMGQNHNVVNSGLHSPEFFKDLWKTISSGKVWKGEIRNRAKNGNLYWVEATLVPFLDETNKPFQYVAIRTDITLRKRTEKYLQELTQNLEQRVNERTAELTEANTALEAFSYSVSHDLRAPVRSVIGFTRIISKEYNHKLDEELKELFSHIEDGAKHMNQIIDGLLDLAKAGKDKLKLAEVDTTTLFRNCWDSICFTSPNKAQFILPKMPVVFADAVLLEQVIVNLLNNAVKYSAKKKHPQVLVGYEATADTITFYVEDNGAGFNMKYYNRLFGAFQRLHGMSEFEGTGVGLMLVKRIVERHGGTVWADAKVGEGATFYFTLPVKQASL